MAVSQWLGERISELEGSIPHNWWIDANKKSAGFNVEPIGRALDGLVGATKDYGEFNLDTREGVTALCRALIAFSIPGILSHVPDEELSSPSPMALVTNKNYSSTSEVAEEEGGHQAKKHRTKEELSSPSVTALVSHAPVSQQPMEAKFLTPETYSEISATVKAWENYAEKQKDILWESYSELRRQRLALGDAYYSSDQRDFREKFRKVHDRSVHMRGAASECGNVLTYMREAKLNNKGFDRIAALYTGQRLQGIVVWEWKSNVSHIAEIIGNPYNIVPANEEEPVVKGAARALLVLTVAQYRARRAQGAQQPTMAIVTLDALNNKVKGIYDHYYFRVFDQSTERVVERPSRGTTGAEGEKKSRWPKTEWHDKKTMILTEEMANKLIAETKPTTWLTAPDELASYLGDFSH